METATPLRSHGLQPPNSVISDAGIGLSTVGFPLNISPSGPQLESATVLGGVPSPDQEGSSRTVPRRLMPLFESATTLPHDEVEALFTSPDRTTSDGGSQRLFSPRGAHKNPLCFAMPLHGLKIVHFLAACESTSQGCCGITTDAALDPESLKEVCRMENLCVPIIAITMCKACVLLVIWLV